MKAPTSISRPRKSSGLKPSIPSLLQHKVTRIPRQTRKSSSQLQGGVEPPFYRQALRQINLGKKALFATDRRGERTCCPRILTQLQFFNLNGGLTVFGPADIEHAPHTLRPPRHGCWHRTADLLGVGKFNLQGIGQ